MCLEFKFRTNRVFLPPFLCLLSVRLYVVPYFDLSVRTSVNLTFSKYINPLVYYFLIRCTGVIWIFQNGGRKYFHEIKYLVGFFGKYFPPGIHVFQSDQFSLLMYLCLLPSSAIVKMDNGKKHGKCSLCNE